MSGDLWSVSPGRPLNIFLTLRAFFLAFSLGFAAISDNLASLSQRCVLNYYWLDSIKLMNRYGDSLLLFEHNRPRVIIRFTVFVLVPPCLVQSAWTRDPNCCSTNATRCYVKSRKRLTPSFVNFEQYFRSFTFQLHDRGSVPKLEPISNDESRTKSRDRMEVWKWSEEDIVRLG